MPQYHYSKPQTLYSYTHRTRTVTDRTAGKMLLLCSEDKEQSHQVMERSGGNDDEVPPERGRKVMPSFFSPSMRSAPETAQLSEECMLLKLFAKSKYKFLKL